jgi:hypothetical protein
MAGKKSRKQKGKEVRMSPPAIPEPKKGATSKGCFSPTFSQPAPKQATSTVAHVPVNPNLLKRFYEALVMLAVLGENRGNPVDEEDFDAEPETSSLGTDKLRRSFLRSLAYLCDYEAGGDRATAIALQKTYPKIIYRMASNKCPNPENDWAKDFVATTLQDLSNLQAEKAEEAQSLLFSKAVKFSLKRISRYAQILEEKIDFVLGDFSKATSTEGTYECSRGQVLLWPRSDTIQTSCY